MLNKAIDTLNLVTGLITVVAAIVFAIYTKINDTFVLTICGVVLLLVGGMYIATSILSIIGKYFTKN